MSTGKGINLGRHFGNREFFYILTNLLLVAFGWLAGWWLKGHSFAAYAQSNYFSNLFRNIFIFYICVEAITELMTSPRRIQAADEVPYEWVHWRARMWETVLVIAVFSDCMGILPVSSGFLARWIGVGFLVIGLIIYYASRRALAKSLGEEPPAPYPVKGIYQVMRFPEVFAELVSTFGAALIFNAWAGVFCGLITGAILVGYALAQDRMMLIKYGSRWAQYQSLVRRWIPGVW
jgi:protein-S-isoprenylcysteine O-methyltransferase Ste14